MKIKITKDGIGRTIDEKRLNKWVDRGYKVVEAKAKAKAK